MALHRGPEHPPHHHLYRLRTDMNTDNTVNPPKTAYIFGAAPTGDIARLITPNNFVIAADGGLTAVKKLGLTPDLALGDFDSLGYIPESEYKTERHPVEKDDTDMGLAVKKAILLGYDRLFLFGGMGGERPDHTLANLQTLVYAAQNGATAFLTDGKTCFTAIGSGHNLRFPANCRGNLSVFSAEGIAEGVNIKGAKYTVENATLNGNFPLGVSNSFNPEHGKSPEISVNNGTLWVYFDCRDKTADQFPAITKNEA